MLSDDSPGTRCYCIRSIGEGRALWSQLPLFNFYRLQTQLILCIPLFFVYKMFFIIEWCKILPSKNCKFASRHQKEIHNEHTVESRPVQHFPVKYKNKVKVSIISRKTDEKARNSTISAFFIKRF